MAEFKGIGPPPSATGESPQTESLVSKRKGTQSSRRHTVKEQEDKITTEFFNEHAPKNREASPSLRSRGSSESLSHKDEKLVPESPVVSSPGKRGSLKISALRLRGSISGLRKKIFQKSSDTNLVEETSPPVKKEEPSHPQTVRLLLNAFESSVVDGRIKECPLLKEFIENQLKTSTASQFDERLKSIQVLKDFNVGRGDKSTAQKALVDLGFDEYFVNNYTYQLGEDYIHFLYD